jgi:folate-binding protein YgfZ
MSEQLFCELTDRALLRISGDDAVKFLQGIVTCNVETLEVGQTSFGALLSPQGKILFDFFIIRSTNSLIIDVDASVTEGLVQRLTFYRLRAAVDITPMDERTHVFAVFGGDGDPTGIVADGIVVTDPRLPAMGARAYIRRAPENARLVSLDEWQQHRIRLGMPAGGIDYAFGDAFPHEAMMDQFKGVDFAKGCYVGQEVVSRMQHRGTARKRLIQVTGKGDLPIHGTNILADGKSCGNITGTAGSVGIANIRIDRAAKAIRSGGRFLAGTEPVDLKIQDWCNFTWPDEQAA